MCVCIAAGSVLLAAAAEENPGGTDVPAQTLEGGAFEITSYDKEVTVGIDHSYDVTERITVNIPGDIEIMEFAIPSGSFRLRNIQVTDDQNAETAFNVKTSSAGSKVTILDKEALKAGGHVFVISYKILEFADRDDTRDLFYYSVLPPDWRQPIADLNITVNLPEGFPCENISWYSGQFGVQDSENRVRCKISKKNRQVSVKGKLIPENFGITLQAELEDGYWKGALDGDWAILAMIVASVATALLLLLLWIIGGRDPRIRRVRQTRPVEGISPAELGYIFDSRTDIRDIVRLILYFGTRGYLRISEYEPKRYRLVRLKDPDGEEKMMRNAYNILFEDVYRNRAVDMDNIGERLRRIEDAIRDDIAAGFSSTEMLAYTPLSGTFRTIGIVLTGVSAAVVNTLKYSYQYLSVDYAESLVYGLIIAMLTGMLCLMTDRKDSTSGESGKLGQIISAVLLACVVLYMAVSLYRNTGVVISAVISAAAIGVSAFLSVIMRARGKGNAELVMRFRQLRRFIYHPTPKELLENYLADKNYYYDMMIYALTFGAEESWARSFLTLDVPEPDWYSDDIEGHAFSNLREQAAVVDYAKDLRSFVRTIESAYEDMQRRSGRRR